MCGSSPLAEAVTRSTGTGAVFAGSAAQRVRLRVEEPDVAVSGARFTKRYEDLLDSDDVDIVSITTPNHLHADQAVAAARARLSGLLAKAESYTEKTIKGSVEYVRARFAGFSDEADARKACEALKKNDFTCIPVRN